ncbi:putative Transcriptional regulator [Candidatus Terasakiella magnetica]|uniref:Putative Transcriptional regulator n=1 Tax=Candidatus Terasakiella magnetica TaxID=1867952 RepID=A0A1C3RIU3_9PROT|nr:LexA family transcriptional regulator [Candidatus Terasakiella magnetica]SCA57187.1 putative Transcriptional regulator [Candidatus Terasakiella magnetica]
MTEHLQIRLKEIAKECGGNRALCEKSGVSERTFANWLAGSSEPKIIGISAIAQAAGVTIDWIVTGSKPKQKLGAHFEENFDTVQIALVSDTSITEKKDHHERLGLCDHMPFSRSFLEKLCDHDQFDQLCVLEVQGDSMDPTMSDGDFVLVDRAQKNVNDGLFAFIFKDHIKIKRLVNVLNGLEIVSDNKNLYPPHRIECSEFDHLDVIGRILWVSKTVS